MIWSRKEVFIVWNFALLPPFYRIWTLLSPFSFSYSRSLSPVSLRVYRVRLRQSPCPISIVLRRSCTSHSPVADLQASGNNTGQCGRQCASANTGEYFRTCPFHMVPLHFSEPTSKPVESSVIRFERSRRWSYSVILD